MHGLTTSRQIILWRNAGLYLGVTLFGKLVIQLPPPHTYLFQSYNENWYHFKTETYGKTDISTYVRHAVLMARKAINDIDFVFNVTVFLNLNLKTQNNSFSELS